MSDKIKTKECIAPGITHDYQFTQAAHGYSCWICTFCGDAKDEAEDSQP